MCLFIVCRVCKLDSVDGSNITTYCVHECEAINRVGMRSRKFIFTGHVNGSVQVRDCMCVCVCIYIIYNYIV